MGGTGTVESHPVWKDRPVFLQDSVNQIEGVAGPPREIKYNKGRKEL